ncbi:N5-carboxyaminoimidazole ribonucleotide mutase [uncultured archaeon]|nr:N5-carboxyaminoimidazole ribonucleotide mutase [uncultured archaeon]
MPEAFNPDFDRQVRTGAPEIIYSEFKTVENIVEIARAHVSKEGRVIFTRMQPEKAAKAVKALKGYSPKYDETSRVFTAQKKGYKNPKKEGTVLIIAAGTSDVPVAEEARIISESLGLNAITHYDVGIAGIHRLNPAIKDMKKAGAIIVAAGMEGALPSVVSGLTSLPVIAVPTSVGYGVAKGGRTALNAMLTSCTPLAVVNIDNGYGAAVLAYRIIRV